MTCSAYWARQINDRIRARWPDTKIVQARAYHVPKALNESLKVPPGVPDDRDPIKHMIALLRDAPSPHNLILMFHPRGGVSVYDKEKPPPVS